MSKHESANEKQLTNFDRNVLKTYEDLSTKILTNSKGILPGIVAFYINNNGGPPTTPHEIKGASEWLYELGLLETEDDGKTYSPVGDENEVYLCKNGEQTHFCISNW